MKLGKRIRQLRKERGITLDELSQKSGVALATLSRMENDKMTGTLKSHTKICQALGTSISELYHEIEDETKTIDSVPKLKRTEHFVHAKRAKYELLVTKVMDKNIMPLMIRISPGGTTQQEQAKPGVEKFIYMIAGTIHINVGDQAYKLRPGDSLYFDASLPHTLENTSKTEAEALCAISPPAL